jgi:hypothetical protein
MNPTTKKTTKTATPLTVKVSKTKIARETAVAVLKRAKRPLPMSELLEKVLADKRVIEAGVPKGTVSAQVNFSLAEDPPRIVRVGKGTYAHVDTPVEIGIPR